MGFARLSLVALISCAPAPPSDDVYVRARERMVAEQIEGRAVKDPRTLAAMRQVPRHLFVAAGSEAEAYADHPLPIGHGQTISQPYVVGFMTQAMALHGGETVLEIGTGSGYQAAVLSEIAARVYTIEILAPLAEEAEARLKRPRPAETRARAGRRPSGTAAKGAR